MKLATLICAGFALLLTQTSAPAFDRNKAELFAELPAGATGPEGLAVAPNGDVYVATFGFSTTGPVSGSGKIYVFSDTGTLLRMLTVSGSSSHLLGIAFHPISQALLVIDFGAAKVLSVDKQSGNSSVFMTVPAPTSGANGLNALTFDSSGNVYVSDSFQGTIWRTGPGGGLATAWVTDPLLTTTGVPPFGANGLGFNKAGTALFVANTGNDTVVKIPVVSGTPGTPAVFVNSINGADGLLVDSQDNIWVAANQSDEIVVVDSTGKVIAKLGDFDGLDNDGTPKGLLFPASPDFSRDKKTLFVSNLALDLRLFSPTFVSVDSQWTAQVKHYTVSKIKTTFTPLANK